MTTRYVIEDFTHCSWPGRLPYRTKSSKRGYKSPEAAFDRVNAVNDHYNAKYGRSPGDLRVIAIESSGSESVVRKQID